MKKDFQKKKKKGKIRKKLIPPPSLLEGTKPRRFKAKVIDRDRLEIKRLIKLCILSIHRLRSLHPTVNFRANRSIRYTRFSKYATRVCNLLIKT